jgi:hypothetical protein
LVIVTGTTALPNPGTAMVAVMVAGTGTVVVSKARR